MAHTPVKMEGDQPYLANGPEDLRESCDVVLKLDYGTTLPIHSQVLARRMSVFSGMVAGGPLTKASAENVVSAPFSDCTVEEATRFLSAIYSVRASDFINAESAMSIARLSHKYGVEEFVKMCDDVLGESAGINTETPEKFPAFLQDQEQDSFMNIMRSAHIFGMPKTLACCEYNVALKAVQTDKPELAVRCDSEPLLDSSKSRIAERYRTALRALLVPANRDSQPCRYRCCHTDLWMRSCGCTADITDQTLRKLLPSPKNLLKMAGADSLAKQHSKEDSTVRRGHGAKTSCSPLCSIA